MVSHIDLLVVIVALSTETLNLAREHVHALAAAREYALSSRTHQLIPLSMAAHKQSRRLLKSVLTGHSDSTVAALDCFNASNIVLQAVNNLWATDKIACAPTLCRIGLRALEYHGILAETMACAASTAQEQGEWETIQCLSSYTLACYRKAAS